MQNAANFVYELGTMRFVLRAFFKLGLTESAQNVTEHTFRVTMIAWMLAEKEGADTNKCIKMALIHDMAEMRTQDQDWISGQYVNAEETLAAEHIFENTPMSAELMDLLEEYEARKTLEARIVKDADRLDLMAEVYEVKARGVTLSRHWSMDLEKGKLFTHTARELADNLSNLHPFDWPDQVHEKAQQKILTYGTQKIVA